MGVLVNVVCRRVRFRVGGGGLRGRGGGVSLVSFGIGGLALVLVESLGGLGVGWWAWLAELGQLGRLELLRVLRWLEGMFVGVGRCLSTGYIRVMALSRGGGATRGDGLLLCCFVRRWWGGGAHSLGRLAGCSRDRCPSHMLSLRECLPNGGSGLVLLLPRIPDVVGSCAGEKWEDVGIRRGVEAESVVEVGRAATPAAGIGCVWHSAVLVCVVRRLGGC